MTANVTPLRELAGSPGNMQDVKDLQAMLANTLTLLETADARNSKLEAENTELRHKIDELEDELKLTNGLRVSAFAEVEGTRKDLDDMKKSKDWDGFNVDPQHVRDLTAARRLIKCGQIGEGLFEIERVLSDMDSGWRANA